MNGRSSPILIFSAAMADNKELAEPLLMVHELKLVYDRVRAIGFDSDKPRVSIIQSIRQILTG